MNLTVTKEAIKGAAKRAAIKVSKHSPEILIGTGIVSMTAGTVVACKQTTKAGAIIEDHKERMKPIIEARALADKKEAIYSEQDQRKDTVIVFSQTGVKFAKLYSVPIALEVLGIVCILSGTHILNRRYVGMAASYAGLQKSYSDYRKRIVDEYGADVDFRAANGVSSARHDYVEVDPETGEQKEIEKDYDSVIDPEHISMYSVLFDEMYSGLWTPNPVSNMAQIKAVEEFWNQRFENRKFVYYHEVLRDLAIWDRLPDEKQQQLVGKGWVWGCGDNHISLGIFDVNKPITDAKKEFIMGYEPSVLIEPNLDGDVQYLFCNDRH